MNADVAHPIALVSPQTPVPRTLLSAGGGFFWWYLDLLDARGNGLVVIWSFGLPFLPGYEAAVRTGNAQPAGSRPSLNVALYEQGAPSTYVLQEFLPSEVEWSDEEWRFGRSSFRRQGARLELSLDCDYLGGGRLQAQVSITGAPCAPAASLDASSRAASHSDAAPLLVAGDSPHGWTPLLVPARGVADVEIDVGRRLHIEGRAYHDRNMSSVSLGSLGIDEWFWGRASHGEEERIIYWVRGGRGTHAREITLALRLDAAGVVTALPDAQLELTPAGRARYGMPRYARVRVRSAGEEFMNLRIARPVDDGPFYLRSFLEDPHAPQTLGYCEGVMPARVDRDFLRPFVRMRVQQPAGQANSLFSPLFSGPRQSRARRFLRHLAGVKHD